MNSWDDFQDYKEIENKKNKANKFFTTTFIVFIIITIITVVSIVVAALAFGFGLLTLFVVPEFVDMVDTAFNIVKFVFPIEVIMIITFIVSIVKKIRANKAFKRMQETMNLNDKHRIQDFIDAEYRSISDEKQE